MSGTDHHPPDVAVGFEPRLRALMGYAAYGSGDDLIGDSYGDTPGWVAEPPDPEWNAERGQVGRQEDADLQDGV